MFPFTCLSLASWSGAWTHPPYHTTYCTFFIQLRSGSRAIQPIADPCLLLESEVIKSYMWPQAPDYLGLLWLKRYMPTRDLSVGTLHGEATWWLYLFCKQCLQTSWVMYRIYYCRNVSWRKDANRERSPVDKASSNIRPMVEPRVPFGWLPGLRQTGEKRLTETTITRDTGTASLHGFKILKR